MSRSQVRFHEVEKNPSLKNRKLLKKFIPMIFRTEKHTLEQLVVIFCSDQYLLALNRQYLNHDTYTDIITFDLSTHPDKVIGEVYISTQRVRENALSYKVSLPTETYRVLFHGILHLCGYPDKSPKDKSLMRMKEDYYLNRFSRFVSRETRST